MNEGHKLRLPLGLLPCITSSADRRGGAAQCDLWGADDAAEHVNVAENVYTASSVVSTHVNRA